MKVQIDPLLTPDSEPEIELLLRAYKELDTAPADAVELWTSLAERGSSLSMMYLGCCFRDGIGVEKDPQRAEQWFRAAADLGVVRARHSLGRLYFDAGQYVKAKQEFEDAAAKGFVPSVHFLGRIYYFGHGVPVDRTRAKMLLETASNGGAVFAKSLLAYDLLHEGVGASAFLKGILLRLETYLATIKTLLTDGITSDRFR